jgi:glycosyltransferase involved in cell wall biosynthesis
MRVVMLSKAMVVGAYQRKAEELARLGVELTVLVPPAWRDRRGEQRAQPWHTEGYTFRIIPLRFNGNFHLHYYPTLAQELASLQPELVHVDEEPYNLATWLALRAARRAGATALFFTWQNLYRRYPPPFRWFERENYRQTPIALAGNQAAAEVLRRKGFGGQVAVIPQFGVDPAIFHPPAEPSPTPGVLRIGYAGGLLPEKGVDLLLTACAGLNGDWKLQIAGVGAGEAGLHHLARTLGLTPHIRWRGGLPSTAMPDFYREVDVLVLPSRTIPTWKEQFGRVLVEAMSCGLAVIGSDSGEIPNVIGNAGLIVAEGDHTALRQGLQRLLDEPGERVRLGQAGRQRVLAHFTMQEIAARTHQVYGQLLARHAAVPPILAAQG